MTEDLVRRHAEAHADNVVKGDINALIADFSPEMLPRAGELAGAMPQTVRSAEVVSVDLTTDPVVVHIRYTGDDKVVTIRSEWTGTERPVITAAAPA